MNDLRVQPVSLEDDAVRLEPLGVQHAADLQAVIDAGTFEFMPLRPASYDSGGIRGYVHELTTRQNHLAFAVIDRGRGNAIGSTSYMNIRPEHRGLEIGCTWLAPSARGTGANTRMKRLLLTHAFDALGAMRVELRTDALNLRSRRAIEKIGALQEGILKSHMLMPDGRWRDTAVYAITADRWTEVRTLLGRAD